MDWNSIVQSLLRWLHVIAGIAWIGHLYFFNFVNSHLVKTYDADSKKKVVPELMPVPFTGSAGVRHGPGLPASFCCCWFIITGS